MTAGQMKGGKEIHMFFPDGHIPESFFQVSQQEYDTKEEKDAIPAKNLLQKTGTGPVLLFPMDPDQRHIRNAVTDDIQQRKGHISVEPYDPKIPREDRSGNDPDAGNIQITVAIERNSFTDQPDQQHHPV